MTTQGIQTFQRYEFKYLLNADMRKVIETEIQQFMNFDGFVHPELGNQYVVRSLYFDDPSSSAFFDKVDGVMIRQKYRIRTYNYEWHQGLPIFLESKGRHNERTYKNRLRITKDDVVHFCEPFGEWSLLERYPHETLIESYLFDKERKRLRPRVLVDYLRKPFVSEYDRNFRVTLDCEVRSSRTNELFLTHEKGNWIDCRSGWTIMEIKFDRRLPKWFHRLIQTYELERLPVSKFCLGMEATGLAFDYS